FVRNRAEQVVEKSQLARGLPGNELCEPLPACELADVLQLFGQDLRKEIQLEGCSQNRRVAQQEAVLRRERVDAGEDHRLDRLRERLAAPAGARGGDELADEERIAARARDQRGERVLGQRSLTRCG